MQNRTLILGFIVAVFILGGLLYVYNSEPVEYKNPNEEEPVFCTQDAKLCPDGSYVGRVPPSCEFEACPSGTTTPIFEDGTLPQQ